MVQQADFEISIIDTHLLVTINLVDNQPSPQAVDLTTATAVYVIIHYGGRHKRDKQATVTDAGNGQIEVRFTAGMILRGINELTVRIEWNNATVSGSTTEYTIEGKK